MSAETSVVFVLMSNGVPTQHKRTLLFDTTKTDLQICNRVRMIFKSSKCVYTVKLVRLDGMEVTPESPLSAWLNDKFEVGVIVTSDWDTFNLISLFPGLTEKGEENHYLNSRKGGPAM
ncbi:hypothetical protein GGF41_000544 [Coemansia sp. RSA 2531]|nr:hypothetical protein GGF41_000544 [Coemansia sp. RSA 2531]